MIKQEVRAIDGAFHVTSQEIDVEELNRACAVAMRGFIDKIKTLVTELEDSFSSHEATWVSLGETEVVREIVALCNANEILHKL